MAQGQRSATSGRKIDYFGQEEYGTCSETCSVYILRMVLQFLLSHFRGIACRLLDGFSRYVFSMSKTNPFYHQTPHELLPKLFGPLRERYAERQGGYTRVLRVEPKKDDQAPSAILELVDGPKDMRFAITAKAIARQREQGIQTLNELTALNVRKVTRYRKDGVEALEKEIEKMTLEADKKKNKKNREKEEGGEDKDEGRRGQ